MYKKSYRTYASQWSVTSVISSHSTFIIVSVWIKPSLPLNAKHSVQIFLVNHLVVKQRCEPRVVLCLAHRPLPRQALHALGEVPVGEDVGQAKGGEVHPGELWEVDALGVVAVGAEVEQDPEFLDPEEGFYRERISWDNNDTFITDVKKVSISSIVARERNAWITVKKWERRERDQHYWPEILLIMPQFTYGMKLLFPSERNFNAENPYDSAFVAESDLEHHAGL